MFHTVYFLLQVTPFRPQVHRGLATQWAHKTEQIKHFQDSVKTHSYMDMSKQEGNYPSKINREKLTMFCEICSLSPRQVPQIPHAKKLHSHHLQINQKKRSLPLVLGDFEPIYQSECKFHPTPSFAQRSIFKQTMLPADQHANGGNSSVRTTKAAKRRWPYLFCQPPLASWNPSFLATSGTFCFWSGESVLKRGICHNSRPSWLFGLLASRACVCVCVCVFPLYDCFTSNLGFEVDLPKYLLLSQMKGPSICHGGWHPSPPTVLRGAGALWSVLPASLAFSITRNIPVDTSLCVMGSKAPVRKNLRPHWGKVVINNGCLLAFFFF